VFASLVVMVAASPRLLGPTKGEWTMMNDIMGGWMMLGMGMLGLLIIILLIFGIAALAKYVSRGVDE